MAVIQATDENFNEEEINNSLPVLVDVWAEWCGPCRMMAPVIDTIAEKYASNLKVCKLDADSNQQSASDYEITGLPCCLIFKDGKEVHRVVGFRSEDALVDELKQHITL